MSQFHLSQRLPLIGVVRTISVLTIIGTVLTPGVEDRVQASTFTEIFDTGALIENAQGPVTIPSNNKIRGEFGFTDIDLYQLLLESDSALKVSIGLENPGPIPGPIVPGPVVPGPVVPFPIPGLDVPISLSPLAPAPDSLDLIEIPIPLPPPVSERKLFLFDRIGRGLGSDLDKLSFIGKPGEIYYLGVNGTVPLDQKGKEIFDAVTNSPIRGRGVLTSWVDPGIGIGIARVYEVSLTSTPVTVPDSSLTMGLITLGILGAVSHCQRKLNLFKSKQSKQPKNSLD